jgi:hypothetical protein
MNRSQPIDVNDQARLIKDLPGLDLHHGEVGVVRNTWIGATVAYEVEFQNNGGSHPIRALLMPQQIALERHSPATPAPPTDA